MKTTKYKCENCGAVHSHKDSYNDKYCYDCIDIETGKLKLKSPKAISELGEEIKELSGE